MQHRQNLLAWDQSQKAAVPVESNLELRSLRKPDRPMWLDLAPDNVQQHASILTSLGIPKLFIDDALRKRHPPKYELSADGWNFLLLRGLHAKSDSLDFDTVQISIFWKQDLLVTRHHEPSPSIDLIRKQLLSKELSVAERGPERWAAAVARKIHDRYIPLLLELEPRIEEIEDQLVNRPSDQLLAELITSNRQLKRLRRIAGYHVTAIKEIQQDCGPELGPYWQDVFEQAERLQSLSNLFSETVTDLINGYLSISAHRLNQVMRVLTVVTVLFVPLTFVAGIYGMNFEYMPELKWHYGYFAALGFMGTISTVLIWLFRRKHWL